MSTTKASVVKVEFDVLVTVHGKDTDEILATVNKIAKVHGVKTSETLLALQAQLA